MKGETGLQVALSQFRTGSGLVPDLNRPVASPAFSWTAAWRWEADARSRQVSAAEELGGAHRQMGSCLPFLPNVDFLVSVLLQDKRDQTSCSVTISECLFTRFWPLSSSLHVSKAHGWLLAAATAAAAPGIRDRPERPFCPPSCPTPTVSGRYHLRVRRQLPGKLHWAGILHTSSWE